MKTLILTFASVVLVSLSSISQIKRSVSYSIDGVQHVANASSDKYYMGISDTIYILESNVIEFLKILSSDNSITKMRYSESDLTNLSPLLSTNVFNNSNMPTFLGDSHIYVVTLIDINNNTVFIYLKITSKSAGIESISDIEESISLNVYPNPTIDFLSVSFYSKDVKKDIEVYSLSGEMVMLESNERQFGQNDIKLDVQHLPSGMYIVKVADKTFKVNKL